MVRHLFAKQTVGATGTLRRSGSNPDCSAILQSSTKGLGFSPSPFVSFLGDYMKANSATTNKIKGINLDFGSLTDKQKQFCMARTKYVAYGGARGGGKSHVARLKAKMGAVQYSGIRILFVRRKYNDLEDTIIRPIVSSLPPEVASYNSTMHLLTFYNGSFIKFAHFNSDSDITSYQGPEYDWIFIEEATQFTEEQFRVLGSCVRGVTNIPRRIYLTCNPGGIGHMWVKRLFISREYKKGENPDDYTFIPATVDDNPYLLESSPDYKAALELLPEDIMRAHRYGDWDALAGTFFPEFCADMEQPVCHVETAPSRIPTEWIKIRAFDYGLDMFACLWGAIDFDGRLHVYREVQQKGLIVSDASELMLALTPPYEQISYTIAPPDMWSRQKDTGRSMAEIFQSHGIGLVKANNNRIQGWMSVKEALKPIGGKPVLQISKECKSLIRNLPALQHDDKNLSDCATEPHDITHITDALRYMCITRSLVPSLQRRVELDDDLENDGDYDEFMCGGEATDAYINFGG